MGGGEEEEVDGRGWGFSGEFSHIFICDIYVV